MTVELQRKGDHVLMTIKDETIIFSKAFTMLEARNLRDFLTDMMFYEGDPTVLNAIIADGGVDTGTMPAPVGFELIALMDSQRRNARKDDIMKEFLKGDVKERADP
jgi:hypothetical protein